MKLSSSLLAKPPIETRLLGAGAEDLSSAAAEAACGEAEPGAGNVGENSPSSSFPSARESSAWCIPLSEVLDKALELSLPGSNAKKSFALMNCA